MTDEQLDALASELRKVRDPVAQSILRIICNELFGGDEE